MFTLHPQLKQDTWLLGKFPLSLVLLHKNACFPWCIMVPQRDSIREIYQLNQNDRQQLLDESCRLSEVMTEIFNPDKMNIAAIGNMVPQLHVHHVARFSTDPAWPGTVWGTVTEQKTYSEDNLSSLRKNFHSRLDHFSQ